MTRWLLGCCVAWLLGLPAAAADRPLVVVIVVDQLRPDYLERFAPLFTSRGFARLLREGSVRAGARLSYANAETAPGHATIASGLEPAQHGVIGNRWFERDAAVDEKRWSWYFDDVYAYRNRELPAVPPAEQWWRQGGSPQYCVWAERETTSFGVPTVSIAHKDSSAILMAGRDAKPYWFDYHAGAFVSEKGAADLPFNGYVAGYVPASQQWTASVSTAELSRWTFDPPAAWPLKNTRYRGTFPHPVTDARGLAFSPFGHRLLFDFALEAVHREKPQLLFISVSSTDNLGHYYGPDSMEVADSMIRLDRDLADFLDALERIAGAGLSVVLTSDHGIQPIPEIARLRDPKADAGRVDLRNSDPHARVIDDLPPLRVELERRLARRFGIPFDGAMPLRNALVYFFEGTGLYLNRRRLSELHLDADAVKRELAAILRNQQGVAGAWTDGEVPATMRNSFRRGRSGDVLVALRPGWIWHWGSNSTTHGQPANDDARVPLIFWGQGVRAERIEAEASLTDVAAFVRARLRYPSATP